MKSNKTQKLLICSALAVLAASTPMVAHSAEMTNLSPALTHKIAVEDPLAGTDWELVVPTYAGLKKAPVLKFADGRISASVGLNSIGGDYDVDGSQINFGPLLTTKMAGSQPLMNAETAYAKSLQGVRNYQLSANGQTLTLRGDQTLTFRLAGRTAPGYAATETKIINVAPQLGPQLDGDKTRKYLQLEDLSEGVSWGRFSEARILGFNFVPDYRSQLRVAVERDARSGEKHLRLLDVLSQHWMRNVTLAPNHRILEVAPTKVDCVGVAPMQCLQVRQPGGKWMTLHAPIAGFNFQEGSRYRLQVAVVRVKNPPTDAANLRYSLVRLLDKMPVIY